MGILLWWEIYQLINTTHQCEGQCCTALQHLPHLPEPVTLAGWKSVQVASNGHGYSWGWDCDTSDLEPNPKATLKQNRTHKRNIRSGVKYRLCTTHLIYDIYIYTLHSRDKNSPKEESTRRLSQHIVWYNISKLPWDTPYKLQNRIPPLNQCKQLWC